MSTPRTTVLVTGGNNGIGLAACQLFAAQPNYHCIIASRSLEKGQKALASIQSLNSSSAISLVQLDITSDASIAAAVEEVGAKHGHLDVLINNAGICPLDFSRSVLRDCLETNAISPAMVTQAFAPLLLQSSAPRVIYVSSLLGSIHTRGDSKDFAYDEAYKAYRISKAALNMIVACDAWEYKDDVKVFAYCPGFVITDLAGMREAKEKAGIAKSPDGSARGLLAIAEGKRDEENGLFLHDEKAGELYPW
jgi:NAD(P)-dependent dehydrogenase (short-subunit alcohol dehydrogenase family)